MGPDLVRHPPVITGELIRQYAGPGIGHCLLGIAICNECPLSCATMNMML